MKLPPKESPSPSRSPRDSPSIPRLVALAMFSYLRTAEFGLKRSRLSTSARTWFRSVELLESFDSPPHGNSWQFRFEVLFPRPGHSPTTGGLKSVSDLAPEEDDLVG